MILYICFREINFLDNAEVRSGMSYQSGVKGGPLGIIQSPDHPRGPEARLGLQGRGGGQGVPHGWGQPPPVELWARGPPG